MKSLTLLVAVMIALMVGGFHVAWTGYDVTGGFGVTCCWGCGYGDEAAWDTDTDEFAADNVVWDFTPQQ